MCSCASAFPAPPCVAQALSVWKTEHSFLEKVLSPAQENASHPVPTASLETWGNLFTLISSQVATNYPLFIFPGALCKTPRARCSEVQDARKYVGSRGSGSLPRVTKPRPIGLPGHGPRAGRGSHSGSSALFFPLLSSPSPPHFSEAFFPVQPCSAQLL